MTQTGVLPCLIHRGTRWWLPLSSSTANLIANLLIHTHRQSATDTATALVDQIRRDHALRYWLMAQTSGEVQLTHLAGLVKLQLVPQLQSTDCMMSAPEISDSHFHSFCQLQQSGCSQQSIAQWLSVLGPAPPEDWLSQWGRVSTAAPGNATCLDYGRNVLDLCLLANTLVGASRVERCYDDSLQQEKDAALKQFAYGLSHEINNPLANISTRAQSLARQETSDDKKRLLDGIVSNSLRAFEMLADVSFYCSPTKPQLESEDINPLILDVCREFQDSWERLQIAHQFTVPDNMIVLIDRNQISDALRALLANATEAIETNGQINIHAEMKDDHFELRVFDSGRGLSPEDRRHAFDPYYSGREAGRGLGLGLCKARRIVEMHGGDLSLSSGLVGTIALMRLPTSGI